MSVRSALHAAADLILPRTCLACGRPLRQHEQHLCLPCAADVPYTGFWRQAHNPMADRFNAVLERHRGTEPMDYAYAVALMYYKGPYRNIPRALKYHADLAAGRFYGDLLGRDIASAPFLADVDLLLPVPLHWTRRRARGYNQAEILARAIASALPPEGAPRCRTDLLVRVRRTRSQTRMSVAEKSRNVSSAFRVPRRRKKKETPAEVLSRARHILLVDDTFTTGATLQACYAALRPFTNARISVATLAVVEAAPGDTGA